MNDASAVAEPTDKLFFIIYGAQDFGKEERSAAGCGGMDHWWEHMKKLKELYVKYKDFIMEVFHFGIVGVANTLMGLVIMEVLYNLIHMNYWLSSGISYFVGSVFSYHANGRLTFKVEHRDKRLPWRFAVNIIVCYLVAFGVAQPLVRQVLASQPEVIVDNVAMILGMGLFIFMNFFGQKLFVFRKKKNGGEEGQADGETNETID